MPELTKLEEAVIDAICRQHPEHAEALKAQLAMATVTSRENTGCGMYTDFEVDPAAPRLQGLDGPFGEVVSVVEHLEMHFMVMPTREGLIGNIEGYSFGGPDISAVDLASASFTPPRPADARH
jgi:hypothetical protein